MNPNPMTGDQFGPYEILGTLGRGGVGEVYRAWDGRLEREVALKLLHDDYPQFGNRERFLIEARAASALNHGNICTVFDIGEKDGWPYLVMELLKGITLKQRIERSSLGAEEIVRIGAEVASALGAAHALGIIHRDIKPANVMLMRQPDGRTRVKVLDFGLAKLTAPLPGRLTHHDDHLTVVGEAVGTVSYMSPEQARGEELDGRSDLFSLGVVMYEMATRRTPFQGATTALLFAQLLGSDPEPIREWNDSIPRTLEKIIFRLLEKDPAQRFHNAAEAAAALEHVAARLNSGRWRRASSPAVPLVRVEEPVARPELPARPEFLREPARTPPRSRSGLSLAESRSSSARIPRAASSASGRAEQTREASGSRYKQAMEPQGSDLQSPDSQSPNSQSSGPRSRRSTAFSSGSQHQGELENVAEPPSVPELRSHPWRRMWLGGGVAAAVLCIAGAVFTVRAAGSHGAVLGPADTLLITAVENHTGVQTLDGSVAEGLEFDLAQTPALSIRTVGEFRTVVHSLGADGQPVSQALARQAAEAAGAHAFAYGEVREGEQGAHSSSAGFSLHVAVLETAGTRELASADARAGRTEEIPGAIDEVTHQLVQQLTGSSSSGDVGRKQVPLAREASGALNALHAYSVAVAAQAAGRRTAALRSFAIATATDPGFVQAQIETAWLARDAGAEVASRQAALRAMDSAQDRSARTVLLAETAGELIGRDNAGRALSAAKTLLQQNSHDASARLAEVRVLRAGGDYRQAEHSAQQALAAGVRNSELFREAELSLIALDRYDDALALEEQAARVSIPHPEIVLAAAYLAGREERVATALGDLDRLTEDAALAAPVRAAYYDNTGQLADGQAAWSEAARAVRSQPAMAGAGEWMLARAALNRALAGECEVALQFAQAAARASAGDQARAAGSLAGALCNSTAGSLGENPDLATRAAGALALGDPQGAVAALSSSGTAGSDPVLTYVRGMAHLQSGSAAAAAQDFQEVLTHRGAIFAGGANLYAVAQLKLARAYEEAGERSRSTEAYRQFLSLWDGAGSADRLRMEAMAGVRGAALPSTLRKQEPSAVAEGRATRDGTVERAVVTRSFVQRAPRRHDPFPTPAWLMPSETAPFAEAGAAQAPGEGREIVREVRKSPAGGGGAELE